MCQQPTHPAPNQQTLWNGRAGHAWVETQEMLNQLFQPFADLLVARAAARPGAQVLDVGCGTGSTTIAVAQQLSPDGGCTGIDISEPMLAAARVRAEREGSPARFLCADAQTYPFAPSCFDLIISRFGVMFFDDPVAAFANLRRAARPGAGLQVITWRSPAENPFMTTAERAAAPLLPNLPARRPGAPGQFALAEQTQLAAILEASGWAEASIQPIDVACTLPERDLVRYFTQLGPLGLVLHETDDWTRREVVATVRAAFALYVNGDAVRFTAACWLVSAQAVAAPDAS